MKIKNKDWGGDVESAGAGAVGQKMILLPLYQGSKRRVRTGEGVSQLFP